MASHAQRLRGLMQRLDVPQLPDRRGEAQANNLALFTSPEPGHQQDVGANTSIAQGYGFVQRSDPQPLGAFALQRPGAFDSTVSVGICLHHRTHGHALPNMFLHRTEVLPQSGE
jgi:hypothetical protein